MVGERAAREGLPLALGGLWCAGEVVEMGVRPRREEACRAVEPALHAGLCGLVLLEAGEGAALVVLVGLSWCEEGGVGVIEARTLRAMSGDGSGEVWMEGKEVQ